MQVLPRCRCFLLLLFCFSRFGRFLQEVAEVHWLRFLTACLQKFGTQVSHSLGRGLTSLERIFLDWEVSLTACHLINVFVRSFIASTHEIWIVILFKKLSQSGVPPGRERMNLLAALLLLYVWKGLRNFETSDCLVHHVFVNYYSDQTEDKT